MVVEVGYTSLNTSQRPPRMDGGNLKSGTGLDALMAS